MEPSGGCGGFRGEVTDSVGPSIPAARGFRGEVTDSVGPSIPAARITLTRASYLEQAALGDVQGPTGPCLEFCCRSTAIKQSCV